ncbi:hypothetical protein [Sphingomonas pseudosanguinis]|uniref:hypothetical protein n=1 Tax=Sphingomonas pseudosanguinis TaxID=413712 RepID=UPI001C841EB7|nr:hypothetical protein [Sphingomonas pseudosanguinis]
MWIGALLTGGLTYSALLILNAWNIAPHSSFRGAIVGGASGVVAMFLVRFFHDRKRR